jgi:hypothetical protein
VDVAAVEFGEVGEALLEGGAVFWGELSGGEPLLAKGVDFGVPDVGAEVVGVEGVDAGEGVVDCVGRALAEAGEEGFFFIEGVARGGFLEVAEGGFEGAAGFVGEEAVGGGIDDAGEDGEEVFDAAVAILEEVEGLLKVGLMGGAKLDGHGGTPGGGAAGERIGEGMAIIACGWTTEGELRTIRSRSLSSVG